MCRAHRVREQLGPVTKGRLEHVVPLDRQTLSMAPQLVSNSYVVDSNVD